MALPRDAVVGLQSVFGVLSGHTFMLSYARKPFDFNVLRISSEFYRPK